MYERNKVKAENFAYVNIKLDKLEIQSFSDGTQSYSLMVEETLISNNKDIGRFVALMHFKIEGAPPVPIFEHVSPRL